jgi:hypothetical protein
MADATPAAEELAKEKGLDLDSIQGSGKDGRILVEDVEAAAEGSDESGDSEKEVVGEVDGSDLLVEESEKSADAYLEHPHVDLNEQSDFEKKDLSAAEDEVQLPGEEAPEVDEEPAKESEASAAAAEAAEEGESDEPDPSLLLSQEHILSRGERERGFYVIPEQVNPRAKALAEAAAEEDSVSESSDSSDSKQSAEEPANTLDESKARPAQQEGVVDTSATGEAPTHGESLVDKAPAVAEAAEGRDADKEE